MAGPLTDSTRVAPLATGAGPVAAAGGREVMTLKYTDSPVGRRHRATFAIPEPL